MGRRPISLTNQHNGLLFTPAMLSEERAEQRLCHRRTKIPTRYSSADSRYTLLREKSWKEIGLNGNVETDTGEYKKRHSSLTQNSMVCETRTEVRVTLGDGVFRKFLMKMIYRKFPKNSVTTCHLSPVAGFMCCG